MKPHLSERILSERIVSDIESMPDVDNYLESCGNSGIRLHVKLYAEVDKIGGTESRLIVDEMNAMRPAPYAPPPPSRSTARPMNNVKLNNSHPPAQPAQRLRQAYGDYISALERVGLENKLNAEMMSYYITHPGAGTMSNATKIECVIRNVLSKAEAKANTDAGRSASALIAGAR